MRKKKISLFHSVVWFLIAALDFFVLCADFKNRADGLVLMIQALIIIISLASAFFYLYVYRKEKEE